LRDQKLPVLCDDPDMFVPLTRAWSFFATAARHEDPTLGWLVGAHVGDHNLNAGLLRKLETAPTLFQALQRLVQLASAEASHIQLGMQERRADVLFYTRYSGMRDVPGYMVSQAYQLGVILGLIRHFLGRDWLPDEIGVEHAIAPVVVQKYFPGSRILTKQPMGYIAVPRACLHHMVRRTALKSGVADDLVLSENFDYLDTLRAVLYRVVSRPLEQSYLEPVYTRCGTLPAVHKTNGAGPWSLGVRARSARTYRPRWAGERQVCSMLMPSNQGERVLDLGH
jgi:hypothetical protein